MNPSLERVHQILQKLLGLHSQLLDLVRSENDALTGADLKELQEVTHSKEVVIHTIHQFELDRVRAMAQIAAEWKTAVPENSLKKFIEILQGKDLAAADRFRSVMNALKVVIDHIDEQNQDNRRLVEKSLEHIAIMKKNVLGEAQPKADTYTQKGRKTETSGGAPRLLSKEA